MEIHNPDEQSENQVPGTPANDSVIQEEKLKRIISEQSNQMISLVDISNAHSSQNEVLKNKIKELESQNEQLSSNINSLKDIFNLQSLLFTLLIFIFLILRHLY